MVLMTISVKLGARDDLRREAATILLGVCV
jgi:hypothetical protein